MPEQPKRAPGDTREVSASARPFAQLSELLSELGRIWSSGADFHASLEQICRCGRTLLPADTACVLMPDKDEFRAITVSGRRAEELQDRSFTGAQIGPALTQVLASRSGETRDCAGDAQTIFSGEFLLAEPIAIGEQSTGLLIFTRRDCTHAFGEVEKAQAGMLARQASFAFGMLRRARELQLIYEVTRAINSSLRLDEVLEFIYQGISRILPADNFYIALWNGRDEIRFEVEVENRVRLPKRSRKPAAGLTEYVLSTGRPLLIARDFPAACENMGIRFSGRPALCWMGVPMVFRQKSVGVIALQSYEQEGVYDEDHLSMLENVAGQAAGAIENARLFQQTCASLEQLQTTQQLLLQSEKLAAIGQLISGIAHELNNPLTGVVGWTQYLLTQGVSENVARHLGRINEQAQRASRIVENLLTFSRQHKPEQTTVRIGQILDNTLSLRAYELRVNNITIHRNYAPDLPPISADPHQLQQVFLNLIINAEQAILSRRSSGNLTVTAEGADEFVRVAVADDGPGIAPDKLKKVFDPFFTTKPIGKGTGLGLSISFGIVQEHRGRIYVESEEGHGARFVVELPVGECQPKDTVISTAGCPELSQRKKLLIVDDEESVRELLLAVLEDQPFDIETASAGEEALQKARSCEYDLIVTDLKMPGLSGAQFCEKLRQLRGHASPRFLFMTGDVLSGETQRFLDSTRSSCVLKPFDITHLKETLLRVLAANESQAAAAAG